MTVIANQTPKQLPRLPLENELTPRQQAFVNHPLANTEPVKAALDAGYSQSYADGFAHSLRKQLLYYILQKRHELAEWSTADAVATLHQVAAIAMSDLTDYFDYIDTADGARLQLKENIKALPASMRAAIKKIEFETVVIPTTGGGAMSATVLTKLELHDKSGMLKELIEIHRLKALPPDDPRRAAALKGLNVSQLQRLEDTLAEIQAEVRTENRAKREKDAIDVTPQNPELPSAIQDTAPVLASAEVSRSEVERPGRVPESVAAVVAENPAKSPADRFRRG